MRGPQREPVDVAPAALAEHRNHLLAQFFPHAGYGRARIVGAGQTAQVRHDHRVRGMLKEDGHRLAGFLAAGPKDVDPGNDWAVFIHAHKHVALVVDQPTIEADLRRSAAGIEGDRLLFRLGLCHRVHDGLVLTLVIGVERTVVARFFRGAA